MGCSGAAGRAARAQALPHARACGDMFAGVETRARRAPATPPQDAPRANSIRRRNTSSLSPNGTARAAQRSIARIILGELPIPVSASRPPKKFAKDRIARAPGESQTCPLRIFRSPPLLAWAPPNVYNAIIPQSWGYSSTGRARRSQCRGWGFESPYLHQSSLFPRLSRRVFSRPRRSPPPSGFPLTPLSVIPAKAGIHRFANALRHPPARYASAH